MILVYVCICGGWVRRGIRVAGYEAELVPMVIAWVLCTGGVFVSRRFQGRLLVLLP